MKNKLLLLFIALTTTVLYSCDNDDDDSTNASPQTRQAFTAKYPSVKQVNWGSKGVYQVADFTNNNIESSAWFDSKGVWYMTEINIAFAGLPQPVKNAFQTSDYAAWRVDDVDMLERSGSEAVYIIEVEQQNKEVDMYYSSDGILIKTLQDYDNDDYMNYIPQPVSSKIESFIKEKYPQARIIEIENEGNFIEVDIIDNNKGKEVYFNITDNTWLYTSWDIQISQLPAVVRSAIANNSVYSGFIIDDADYVESPTQSYYLIELEKGNSEMNVKVDPTGNIIP